LGRASSAVKGVGPNAMRLAVMFRLAIMMVERSIGLGMGRNLSESVRVKMSRPWDSKQVERDSLSVPGEI